jgi:hypothetical protein
VGAALGVVPLDEGDAAPHLALGLLRVAEKRPSDAWPALDGALTLAPDDFATQYMSAIAMLRSNVDASDARITARARAALQRATTLNPSSADASAWLAYANMLERETLVDASAAIVRAIALAPGRLEYRLRYADIALLRGAVDIATPLLSELAASQDPAVREGAKQRLATIAQHKK